MSSKVINMVGGGAPVDGMTATPEKVLAGEKFIGAAGEAETGTMPDNAASTVTLDASTTSHTIPAGRHSGSGKVQIVPQTKAVTPGTSEQTVTPDSGKVLTAVTVDAIQTEEQTFTPTAAGKIITPSSGKFLSSVSVSAVPTQSKTVTPKETAQTVYPDAGKFLSSVLVEAAAAAGGGKQVYRGTLWGGSNSGAINTGITIKSDALCIIGVMDDAIYKLLDGSFIFAIHDSSDSFCFINSGGVIESADPQITYDGTNILSPHITDWTVFQWIIVQ